MIKWVCGLLLATQSFALDLCFPTANDALLRGREADFFQPTVEGTVESGMFGCGRVNGRRFHEGIDIKCLRRDKRGEPVDPVVAVADGRVVFINAKPGLSNYGRYVIVEHQWDGVQVFTLYAHLREIADGLSAGQDVRKSQRLATLGRSSSAGGISVDRAHLHFEINFMLNPHFHIWYPKKDPRAPPFGNFNGKNLIGLDAAAFFRALAANPKLNFADYLANQPLAFTVLVSGHRLPRAEAVATTYEVGVTAWGLPMRLWTRDDASPRLPTLHRVNETELARNGCRRLVERAGKGWRFTAAGKEWLESLTFVPQR